MRQFDTSTTVPGRAPASASRLCVVVTGSTTEELRRNRDAVTDADLVELRLDFVDRPDARAALAGRQRPVIATCRASYEGGRFQGSEEARRAVLEDAIAAGAEYIDIEAQAAFAPDLIRARGGRGVIVSAHYFDGMPSDLSGAWRAVTALGGEIGKIAVAVRSLTESVQVLALGSDDASNGRITIAMGNAGLPSRVLTARAGSLWTYAGQAVAPGQLTPGRLLGEFRFRQLQSATAIYGVVGNPVMHSRSPRMHNAGFRQRGLDAVYLPLEAADADDFVRFARAMDLQGASITAPFKLALMAHMDHLEPLARRVGAVNTLVVRDGRWIGANTDVYGFAAPLQRRMDPRGARVTVLGAGGAARAVAVGLMDLGARVTVCARRAEAAADVADLAGGTVGDFPPRPGSWDVLVNAIPAGTDAATVSPMGDTPLDGRLVYELIYAPERTRLLQDAEAAGLTTIGGLEMLVAQAERQFELWTGQAPPPGLFDEAARTGV